VPTYPTRTTSTSTAIHAAIPSPTNAAITTYPTLRTGTTNNACDPLHANPTSASNTPNTASTRRSGASTGTALAAQSCRPARTARATDPGARTDIGRTRAAVATHATGSAGAAVPGDTGRPSHPAVA
jgi:hypothetical protein